MSSGLPKFNLPPYTSTDAGADVNSDVNSNWIYQQANAFGQNTSINNLDEQEITSALSPRSAAQAQLQRLPYVPIIPLPSVPSIPTSPVPASRLPPPTFPAPILPSSNLPHSIPVNSAGYRVNDVGTQRSLYGNPQPREPGVTDLMQSIISSEPSSGINPDAQFQKMIINPEVRSVQSIGQVPNYPVRPASHYALPSTSVSTSSRVGNLPAVITAPRVLLPPVAVGAPVAPTVNLVKPTVNVQVPKISAASNINVATQTTAPLVTAPLVTAPLVTAPLVSTSSRTVVAPLVTASSVSASSVSAPLVTAPLVSTSTRTVVAPSVSTLPINLPRLPTGAPFISAPSVSAPSVSAPSIAPSFSGLILPNMPVPNQRGNVAPGIASPNLGGNLPVGVRLPTSSNPSPHSTNPPSPYQLPTSAQSPYAGYNNFPSPYGGVQLPTSSQLPTVPSVRLPGLPSIKPFNIDKTPKKYGPPIEGVQSIRDKNIEVTIFTPDTNISGPAPQVSKVNFPTISTIITAPQATKPKVLASTSSQNMTNRIADDTRMKILKSIDVSRLGSNRAGKDGVVYDLKSLKDFLAALGLAVSGKNKQSIITIINANLASAGLPTGPDYLENES